MKKLVTALLVVAMMLSLCSVAFAAEFSDTKDLSKDVQVSISKLNSLNIINGYPDGTFQPANNITRAEFAKIAVVMAKMGTSADTLKNSATKFKDVKAGQWYTGWINVAASQGYVKGFPDGTYRPDKQISNAEVVTVLLRILGYNDNLPGPWPVDYIAKAGALDVTKNVSNFDANVAAVRSNVAVMADATLDCNVVLWDNDKEDFLDKYNKGEKTLLADNFSGANNEDYIVKGWKKEKNVFKVELSRWNGGDEDEQSQKSGWFEVAGNCTISDGSTVPQLKDKMVDFIYNSDDKNITFIEVTSTFVGDYEDDFSFDGNKQFKIDGVKYDITAQTEDEKGNKVDTYVEGEKLVDLTASKIKLGYYRAYLTADNEVYMVMKRPADIPGLVKEYNESTQKLTLDKSGSNKGNYNFKDQRVVVVKDNKYADLKDLAKNDAIYVKDNITGLDYYVEAYTIKASGKFESSHNLDSAGKEQFKIDGTKYRIVDITGDRLSRNGGKDFNKKFNKSGLDDVYGSTVKYFLTKENRVAYMIAETDGTAGTSNEIYGAVIDIVSYDNINKKVTKIKVLKADGSEVTYAIDTDEVELKYGDIDDRSKNQINIDDFIKFKVNKNNEIDSLTFLAKYKPGTLAKYWQDGTLAQLTAANCQMSAGSFADYYDSDNDKYIGTISYGDTDNNKIKFNNSWYYLNDKSVCFNVYENDEKDDEEAKIERNKDVVDWAEDLKGSTLADAYVEYDGNDVEYLVILQKDVSGSKNADYACVTDIKTIKGDKYVEFDAKGKSNEKELKQSSALVGAVYDYKITNNKFDIKDLVFNPENKGDETIGIKNYGLVTDVDSGRNAVEIAFDTNNDGKFDAAEKDAAAWYFADGDTVIYDYSDYYDNGDDPVYCSSTGDIAQGDFIKFRKATGTDGSKNICKLFCIVNNVENYFK